MRILLPTTHESKQALPIVNKSQTLAVKKKKTSLRLSRKKKTSLRLSVVRHKLYLLFLREEFFPADRSSS